jgi:uncharacterized membrane protein
LKIKRDKKRILHLSGRPSWDQRFLREILTHDSSIRLFSYYILRSEEDLAHSSSFPLSLTPFPKEKLFKNLDKFNLIIFQNLSQRAYGLGKYLSMVQDYVKQGGAFLMIGGEDSFSSGGYQGTDIEKILPVDLFPLKGGKDRLISLHKFRPVLTQKARFHPIMKIYPQHSQNTMVWRKLVLLEGANLVKGVKKETVTLLAHPFIYIQGGERMPILAVREYGKGRTMALLTDSIWRWRFSQLQRDKNIFLFRRFFKNAINWLVQDSGFKPLKIKIKQTRYIMGDKIKVLVELFTHEYIPKKGTNIIFKILRLTQKEQILSQKVSTNEYGRYYYEFIPKAPDIYEVSVKSENLEAKQMVVVEPDPKELKDGSPKGKELKMLASLSKGTYLEDPEMLSNLKTRALMKIQTRIKHKFSFYKLALFLLFIFVILEWRISLSLNK